MQKAELVVTMLNHKSKGGTTYKFKRLYRNLFNPDFYLKAYSKIYWKEGNMTKGTDFETIDGFNMNKINAIIEDIRHERYYPKAVRRIHIPKKKGKTRPLGIPTFKDKIVQEIIRQILEAIYEPHFSRNSHGFRPNRSCHTALTQLKNCNGVNWVIEGDITGFFDNIDHDMLMLILKRRIDDGRFIELIRRFLEAGYMENGITRNSINGTPQGGIISPILANIYLNELDIFMNEIRNRYNKGEKRRRNKEYRKLEHLQSYWSKKGNIEKAKHYRKEKKKIPNRDPYDPDYQRIRYIRYADDFIVCINGSKEVAKRIRAEIASFLGERLKLELNTEKTVITNFAKDKVRFLGYDLKKTKRDTQQKMVNGYKTRTRNGVPTLSVPTEIISKKIKEFTRKGKPIHIGKRTHMGVRNIIHTYNAEIRGLYNYYSLANNVSQQIYRFKYYHYYSLARTVAAKERTHVSKIIKKYGIEVKRKVGTGTTKIIGIRYATEESAKVLTYFNDSIKMRKSPIIWNVQPYEFPYSGYCEVLHRLARGKCELCNTYSGVTEYEVHHIRNLKDEVNKYSGRKLPDWLSRMKQMRRKTLIVCSKCHKHLHGLRN